MDAVFFVSAAIAVASAMLMVTRRNPVYSAVWLLVTFISVAVIFLSLSAPFLAAIHVLVYTGAILVLFLFVIMLLNLKEEELGDEAPMAVRGGIAVTCAALFGFLARAVLADPSLAIPLPAMPAAAGHEYGSVENVGLLLFQSYGLPFELVSVLIIVAMYGAMVLAKKKSWV